MILDKSLGAGDKRLKTKTVPAKLGRLITITKQQTTQYPALVSQMLTLMN